MKPLPSRSLGRSGLRASTLGLGCWAIGGPFFRGDEPLGYGKVDDQESLAAVARALDLGITLFDTSDFYGCGHSERLLGRALASRRDSVTIVTKFGYAFDESSRQVTGHRDLPRELEACLDASLARLATDHVDFYLLHLRDFPLERVDDLIVELERLADAGKLRAYGWSTDDRERAAAMALGPRAHAIELAFNVVQGNADLLGFCEQHELLALARSPLAMGALTRETRTPRARDDIRSRFDPSDPRLAAFDAKRRELLAALTFDGRTPAQGALSWLLARSPALLPIPGFRTVAQVEENVAALALPPFPSEYMDAIRRLVSDLGLPPDPLALRVSRPA